MHCHVETGRLLPQTVATGQTMKTSPRHKVHKWGVYIVLATQYALFGPKRAF